MEPTTPFWFKQRQCKLETAGAENTYRVTGPNLGEAFLSIRSVGPDGWQAAFRRTADGPDVAVSDAELPSVRAAWEAAFELYRNQMIV